MNKLKICSEIKNSLYLHAIFTISKVQNFLFISVMRLCQYQSFLLNQILQSEEINIKQEEGSTSPNLVLDKSKHVVENLSSLWTLYQRHKPNQFKTFYDKKDLKRAKNLKDQADKAYANHQLEKAEQLYNFSIAASPLNLSLTTIYVKLSEIYFETGRFSQSTKIIHHINSLTDNQLDSETKKLIIERLESSSIRLKTHISSASLMPEVAAKFPKSLYDNFTIKTDVLSGRGLIAKSRVKPGEVCAVERAYAACLFLDNFTKKCYSCMSELVIPVGCRCCSHVVYCSKECEVKCWEYQGHRIECQFLGSIILGTPAGRLCIRTVLQGMSDFPELFEERNLGRTNQRYDFHLEKMVEKFEVNGRYREILELHADFQHYMSSSWEQFKKDAVYSIMFADFICSQHRDKFKIKKISREILAYVLLLHYCQKKYNSIILQSYKLDFNHPQVITGFEEYAHGFFPGVSLTNHSCAPNSGALFINDNCYYLATREIQPGFELLNNYGPIFTIMDKSERKERLLSNYGFTCFCLACKGDYPLEDSCKRYLKCENCIETTSETTCPNCGNKIDVEVAISNITEGRKLRNKYKRYLEISDYYRALQYAQSATDKFEESIGLPDFDVAVSLFDFFASWSLFLKN